MEVNSISSSKRASALVLRVLQHSHIAPEVTYIHINNIYICHLASQIGQLVQNNWFISASVFLLSPRIRPCARVVALSENASTIQNGYRKWGTHVREFSQTLAHGNSKNEIRQRDEDKKRRVSMERIKAVQKMKSQRPKLQLRPIFPQGSLRSETVDEFF